MSDQAPSSSRPLPERFPPELEAAFQSRYYAEIRSTLRVASLLLAVLFLAYAARDYYDTRSVTLATRANGAPVLFCLAVFCLTFWGAFERYWQPAMVGGGWVTAALSLESLASLLGQFPDIPVGPFRGLHLFYGYHLAILIVCLAVFRLQFMSALGLHCGVLALGIWAFVTRLLDGAPGMLMPLARFLQPVLLVFVAVLVAAYLQERLSRRAFFANHLLDEERSDERRKRVETEGKLKVLGDAIGGIVHDLGNPLTAVQMGAGVLETYTRKGAADEAMIRECSRAIHHGTQMLNYLRLALVEQTRVLEGGAVPLELRTVKLREVIEAGARFQKTNLASGRTISLAGDDLELCADRMKLTTVLMNLIGNALKYSDGEVRVTWREHEDRLLVAVLDQGTAGSGVTEAQARQLFVPFGRLEAHAGIEGTGLGLLSVRNVVEAHTGEVFIEGYVEGLPGTGSFTTASGSYPSLLDADYRTAFVLALPRLSSDRELRSEERSSAALAPTG